MNSDDLKQGDLEKILLRLDTLEERISNLESDKKRIRQLQTSHAAESEEDDSETFKVSITPSALFESNLGEYGLAWLGNIVLFFAIAFLGQYFMNIGKPIISFVIGTISICTVFAFSIFSRKNYSYLSYMFNLFGFIILYYVVLRLHFYTDKQVISNYLLETFLLLMVVGFQLFRGIKKNSQALTGLAYTFGMFTAFACNQMHLFFLISIATICIALYYFWQNNWWKSLTYTVIITYFIYLVWILKNHVALFKTPDDLAYYFAFFYFSITTAIYSLVVFKKPNDGMPEIIPLATILMAGIAYSLLLFILVLMNSPKEYISLFAVISIYSITYSIILKYYSPWKYSPALYAMYGFVAISVAIYGIYHFPDAFLLLFYQSFLVLIVALWYRSQTITLINTFLLVILILVYYKLSGILQFVNFSIPAVAFLSARIINWQKERLNIKTDFIRNIYLFTLFFTLLYATKQGLPAQFITVSWLLISGIYFGLSILLKNIKYRWMAMANLLVAALYLFLVDMAKTDIIYRILAFLVFAVVSITISTYYVRRLKKRGDNNEE
jgi:hypothetical protein